MSVNEVHIDGNTVSETTVIKSKKNEEVGVRFRIAYRTDSFKNPSGFISVTAWKRDMSSEHYEKAKSLTKGEHVTVKGALGFDTWGTEDAKRSTVTLVAAEVA